VRTRPIVAASALIAVAALVAIAGPADTAVPGGLRTVEQDDLRPLALHLPTGSATTVLTPPMNAAAAGRLRDDSVLLEPIGVRVPTGRADVRLPRVSVGVVVKNRWRTAGYSWYGPGFYGSGTACGQTYSQTILGVAHRSLPCGTRVTFRNPRNGRTITVPVIDRGPYVSGRLWDLSRGTCEALGNCYTSTIQWRLP
jgi:hypothetical protein